MKQNPKKLLFVLIPLLAILVGCLALLILLPDNSSGKVYVEQISSARKFVESGEYQKAVDYYKKAIEKDKTKEEPYLELADVYNTNLNDVSSAISILEQGYENTGSDTIKQKLNSLQVVKSGENTDVANSSKGKSQETLAIVNTSYTDIFSTYNYGKYTNEFTLTSENAGEGVYTVKYAQYDAEFEYNNSGEVKTIDGNTRRPFDYARPSKIKMNDLSLIFPGIANGITKDDFKKMRAENITVSDYDNTLKTCLISFDLDHLHYELGCDKDGKVTDKNCYNAISPEPSEGTVGEITVKGKVIDVTTGKEVEKYNIIFHKGKESKNGEAVANAESTNGTYEIKVPSDDYTVEVKADKYNTEFFNLYVPNTTSTYDADFSISPELAANQVRFVLEWGASPHDLDSHLEGTCNTDGKNIPVNVYFVNKSVSYGGKTIAELDVDDQDGFGPETITLNNTSGKYEYRVHRYSSLGSLADSGATVKIYTSNSSNPITLAVPNDVDSEWWTVCTVENGEVKDLNGRRS